MSSREEREERKAKSPGTVGRLVASFEKDKRDAAERAYLRGFSAGVDVGLQLALGFVEEQA